MLIATDLRGAILARTRGQGARLNDARSLTCEQLVEAEGWEYAYRDVELACGAPIPERPDEITERMLLYRLSPWPQ